MSHCVALLSGMIRLLDVSAGRTVCVQAMPQCGPISHPQKNPSVYCEP